MLKREGRRERRELRMGLSKDENNLSIYRGKGMWKRGRGCRCRREEKIDGRGPWGRHGVQGTAESVPMD